ncbi:hypothetical protein D3874_13335 [Oleomonas cavernae]|uniref:Glutamine amidotransferase domain-containing protein n=1 Tax=Oleomonas cavernae TaxID=2320859 RepID=A0A418WCY5_9PROT|nr:hypothetical protein [Oleomonas cavernae]RJF87885.1 hypothetical protein D3874_13335 [Oleomonas cavernae]
MSIGFETAPLVAWWLIAILGGAALALSGLALWRRSRGAWARLCLVAALLAVLINPIVSEETRKGLSDIALIAIDRSASQRIGTRTAETDAALATLRERLARLPDVEVREVQIGSDQRGTPVVSTIQQALGDIPRDRFAGVILLSDGRAADVPPPETMAAAGAITTAPFHLLATGQPGERDRRLTVLEAPSYAVVGKPVPIRIRVDDGEPGERPADGAQATVTLAADGGIPVARRVPVGEPVVLVVTPDKRGPNVLEISVEAGPAELTPVNNDAVVTINGIRDRLRVLLVSGEPHMGERAWRNILKSDPSVDLVHFTILRPPQKQDATPVVELSLIAFPTRELFEEKIGEFDLVIFDRYRQRGILPANYLANVVTYVENGGALMIAASPEADAPLSLYESALAPILPARPRGPDLTQAFRPALTPEGRRHPVTALLPNAGKPGEEAGWGRWLRMSDIEARSGNVVMTGAQGRPLLILDRVGKGRVALLASDEAWLWQRGFEGGGPQAELLRRIAHWSMQEPDLEEERLRAYAHQGRIEIERRSLKPQPPPVEVESPSGARRTIPLEDHPDGVATASVGAEEPGLWRVSDGTRVVTVAVGEVGGREMADVRATLGVIDPLAEASDGSTRFISGEGMPDLRRVRPDRPAAGASWIGLRQNGAYEVTAVTQVSLLPAVLALLLVLGLLVGAWLREGR